MLDEYLLRGVNIADAFSARSTAGSAQGREDAVVIALPLPLSARRRIWQMMS